MTLTRNQRAQVALAVLAVATALGCSTREQSAGPTRAQQSMRFQVLCVGYSNWARWEDATSLDVREYTCAPGDSFGGGSPPNCCQNEGPFVLVAVANDSTALVRYPSGLAVQRGWAIVARPLDQGEASRRGPDTLTVSTKWRHFATETIDGGCVYSVRINRSVPPRAVEGE